MSSIFLTVLNMSLTAGYVALAVMIVRLLLKKVPKIFSYALWAVVLFRLLCPFTFESSLSLIPGRTAAIPQEIVYSKTPAITTEIGIVDIDNTLNHSIQSSLPPVNPAASLNAMSIIIEVGALIWILGIVVLLSYVIISYLKLKYKLFTATLVKDNIFETDRIQTPFVLGLIKPIIYIPTELSGSQLDYIIKHEQTHIKRYDYIIKPAAFLALTLHWFNPLIWLSYFLMVKDMEMSCDESVIRHSKEDIRVNYSSSLLFLSAKQSGLLGPLAFGESNVKARIKNVLNYKKPAFWVIAMATAAVMGAVIGLLANPLEDVTKENGVNSEQITSFALEMINRDIANYETNPEVNIIDSKITRLELMESFDSLAATPIDVYALEYRLLPEDLNKVVMAGGMQIDENGWLKETCSMGSPLLVIARKIDSVELMGTLWTGGVQEDGGLESSINVLLNREAGKLVEEKLSVLMSSPKTSSNPQDYIDEHPNAYEDIKKLGGEDALQYMLSQFETGSGDGLRGELMMRLCKELLGVRNNVGDKALSPQEWYNALAIREEIKVPDFMYNGNDSIEKLVYVTEIKKKSDPARGFTVVAPKIFGSYEEDGLLKVFVTTYSATYRLYGNVLDNVGGSVIPSAITYKKDDKGNYVIEKYEQARDGTDFAPSIREFCTMPASGEDIPGLSDKILNHYGNYGDIRKLERENLFKHLRANGIEDARLRN